MPAVLSEWTVWEGAFGMTAATLMLLSSDDNDNNNGYAEILVCDVHWCSARFAFLYLLQYLETVVARARAAAAANTAAALCPTPSTAATGAIEPLETPIKEQKEKQDEKVLSSKQRRSVRLQLWEEMEYALLRPGLVGDTFVRSSLEKAAPSSSLLLEPQKRGPLQHLASNISAVEADAEYFSGPPTSNHPVAGLRVVVAQEWQAQTSQSPIRMLRLNADGEVGEGGSAPVFTREPLSLDIIRNFVLPGSAKRNDH